MTNYIFKEHMMGYKENMDMLGRDRNGQNGWATDKNENIGLMSCDTNM